MACCLWAKECFVWRIKMEVKKSTLYMIGILIGNFMLKSGNAVSGGNNGKVIGTGEIEKITLSMKNYNYYPNTVKVKQGSTVRMYLDESIYGCLRSFTVPAFGVKKYLKTPEDYVEFVANKKGEFTFACSMGMGTGK